MAVFILAVMITSVVAQPAYEHLSGLSTPSSPSPISGWLNRPDFLSKYCRPGKLLMRTDLFIVEGEELIEKLRRQLGVQSREEAVRHFLDNNKPEIIAIVDPHIARLFPGSSLLFPDLYHVIKVASMSQKDLYEPIIPPLRDLLAEYTENRARFPFYDYLPTVIRRDYLEHFTPVPWEQFPVRPGAPGSGVVAYLPRSSDEYQYSDSYDDKPVNESDDAGESESDDGEESGDGDLYCGSVIITLHGIGGHRNRIVNLKDGRSADYIGRFDDIMVDDNDREVLFHDHSESWKSDSAHGGLLKYSGKKEYRDWLKDPYSYGYLKHDGDYILIEERYKDLMVRLDLGISEISDDITSLTSRGPNTPQQFELLGFINHKHSKEYEACIASIRRMGFNPEKMKPIYRDDIAAILKEIIEDGHMSGRLSGLLASDTEDDEGLRWLS